MQGPTSSPVGGRGGGVARSSETETRESSATAFHFQTKTNEKDTSDLAKSKDSSYVTTFLHQQHMQLEASGEQRPLPFWPATQLRLQPRHVLHSS